ncbi:NADAR family protein [Kitasatospora purpeofusca]|uniref:NADAR family protein n=1 Tax=Kitasatospora purpeofusca TaxID=67352 RepID=UPI0035D799E8
MFGKWTTHRTADGVRIPGTWRHAFIHNGDHHFLTDLFIYADGLVDCWELVTVEEFEEKLRTGRVATSLPEGGKASADRLAEWKFSEPQSWLTPELLVAEVRDTIDQLNGRPDSTGRCLAAVDAFFAERTEQNLAAVRAAFLAVPGPQRRYALGSMDHENRPLRILVAGPGNRTCLPSDGTVTQEDYDSALAHVEERAPRTAERVTRVPSDGPATPHAPAVKLYHSSPTRPVDGPGKLGLRHDYPAPITVADTDYPSAAHAYWALLVAEPDTRNVIATAETATAARKLAAAAPRREGWEHVRTAVMTHLLRAKYDQHPELAEILLATDDATLIYDDMNSTFWGDNAGQGRNWSGRLLELVRSELRARRAGILGV